jgi:hypothetical protein
VSRFSRDVYTANGLIQADSFYAPRIKFFLNASSMFLGHSKIIIIIIIIIITGCSD